MHYGPRRSFQIVESRLHQRIFDMYWRVKATRKSASWSWPAIQKKHSYQKSFQEFFDAACMRNFPITHFDQQLNSELIIKEAQHATHGCFDLLGSDNQCFTILPWHHDFRLEKQQPQSSVEFSPATYYKDFTIAAGNHSELTKDIKIPWELSRFHYLFVLGYAYKVTTDEQYAQTFAHHVNDWIDNNPFLLGPNWICPMDVGIRALNWVWAFYFFQQSPTILGDFWQRIICSLYDHFVYLEHNWEIADSRTSNHYLSDLIGYLYLCYFFQNLPGVDLKAAWCYQELLREWDKQIFDEGTDYEGSTSYHRLVTEIFYHVKLMSELLGFPLAKKYHEKLAGMLTFIDWCTPRNGTPIQIGDNDSGKILYPGISGTCTSGHNQVKHFTNFGLSIIKTDAWHISLRHHAYNERQPAGHFHNDAASITVAYQGINLIVDPGSYMYTPSIYWRNYFRSVTVHNSFYPDGYEPVTLDDRIFLLDLQPNSIQKIIQPNSRAMVTYHDQYKMLGLRAHRAVSVENNTIIIKDHWQKLSSSSKKIKTYWNFTLGSEISAIACDDGWLLQRHGNTIARFFSTIHFTLHDGFISPSYGVKVPCKRLYACYELGDELVTSQFNFGPYR